MRGHVRANGVPGAQMSFTRAITLEGTDNLHTQHYGAFAAEKREGEEAMEELVSCEGTSSFVFETMFSNLPDTEG